MKAALVYGENDIRIVEVPIPEPGPGEVLIKVKGSGVCATDVKILGGSGLPEKLPTILGHEVSGIIESTGEGVTGLKPGQRVAVYPIAACGECFFCKQDRHSLCVKPYGLAHGADGGFAEYVLVPHQIVDLKGIIDIGDMPFDLAAIIEPLSCCLAASSHCGTKKTDTVVIIGCGPLGLLHTIVSKEIGARVIAVDINKQRLQKAKNLGADYALNPEETGVEDGVYRITGIGADVVIAAIGIPEVIEESFPLVRKGGVFNIFGGTPRNITLTLDPRWLHYGEIVLTGTFAASLGHFKKAFEFASKNREKVEDVISDRCGLDDILKAVDRVRKGTALKTVVLF